jgi:hypothetical protein
MTDIFVNVPGSTYPTNALQYSYANNILTPTEANLSISSKDLRKDFEYLGSYLNAIVGGDAVNVIRNRRDTLGNDFLYTSTTECKTFAQVEDTDPAACKSFMAKKSASDKIYSSKFIQLSSTGGLITGIIKDEEGLLNIPGAVISAISERSSDCKCKQANVIDNNNLNKTVYYFSKEGFTSEIPTFTKPFQNSNKFQRVYYLAIGLVFILVYYKLISK